MDTTESVMRTVVVEGIELPAAATGAFTMAGTERRHHMGITNWIMAILLLSLLLAGSGGAIYWILTTDQFTVAKVRIEGEINHIDPATIQNTLNQHILKNFFILNLNNVRDSLETLPWIAEAHIRRTWPLTLTIWVRERAALAHWGERSLVSPGGVVFTPDPQSIPPNLMYLQGPDGSENEVISNYHWLKERFASRRLEISKLVLSERRAWYIDVTSGLHLSVGTQKLTERIENFLKYLPRLPQPEILELIDLRYSNGFAARWRPMASTP